MTSLHVLFVDDEQAILDGLRNSLRKERKRWEMTFALGGQQALEHMKQTPADVVAMVHAERLSSTACAERFKFTTHRIA